MTSAEMFKIRLIFMSCFCELTNFLTLSPSRLKGQGFDDSMPVKFSYLSGSTPLGMYKKLIEFHKAGEISFKYVKTFNMDEYVGM